VATRGGGRQNPRGEPASRSGHRLDGLVPGESLSHRFLASQGRQNRRGGWIPQGDRNPVQASDEKQVKRRLGEHQGKHHHGPQPHRHDVGGSHSHAGGGGPPPFKM